MLVARDEHALQLAAGECEEAGALCMIMALDVGEDDALERVASRTVARWGRIDVWINNAGVGVVGDFTDVAIEEHRRVLFTNLIAYFNGAHAALKVFKKQGSGVLINNASVAARLITPHLAAYTASKFGVRALTHTLRQDLKLGGFKNIHVSQINPGVIDTGVFDRAGNESGHSIPKHIPMIDEDKVAEKILSLVAKPKAEIFVGNAARLGSAMYSVLPGFMDKFFTRALGLYHKSGATPAPKTSGNLFEPLEPQSPRY